MEFRKRIGATLGGHCLRSDAAQPHQIEDFSRRNSALEVILRFCGVELPLGELPKPARGRRAKRLPCLFHEC
jgi:hypothetical protein